ncbi:MAG TPA: class I SAM-dependent methyltransferase [Candidatus Nitrosotalea sp.]|nr:class I SAM-dependent methyltransferase [Candidatus Nitrosotalea sp.]
MTVEDYDKRERQAVTELPNRVVEMVSPVTFASEGYPSRVRSDAELWKYLDVMHETRFERDLNRLFQGALSPEEFTQLRRVAENACGASQALFGRKLTVRGSLLPALNVFRHIADIFQGTPTRVFEIGPGSGCLGSLFILNGWSYAATDIAQAFYLIQNRVWDHAAGGRLEDLAGGSVWDGKLEPRRPLHFPWWEFFKLLDQEPLMVDVVTCNHALAEMHANSLAFSLRVARRMLRGGGIKAFVFEGWGFEKFHPRSAITKKFYECGFRLVHNDDLITVFAPDDADCATPAARLPRFGVPVEFGLPPVIGPARSHSSHRSRSGWSALKAILGSQEFLAGFRELVRSLAYLPPQSSSNGNIVSGRIFAGRQRRLTGDRIPLAAIEDFYAELLGSKDLRTADEKFLRAIDRTY